MFKEKTIDKIGSFLAITCLIHCLLLPIILTAVPFLFFLGFMKSPLAETLMIIFAIGNGIFAIRECVKKHNNFIIPGLFLSGILLLALNFIAHTFVQSNEYIITIGAFLLGLGHITNQRFNRCPKCHEH